jgi:hypothetical protein
MKFGKLFRTKKGKYNKFNSNPNNRNNNRRNNNSNNNSFNKQIQALEGVAQQFAVPPRPRRPVLNNNNTYEVPVTNYAEVANLTLINNAMKKARESANTANLIRRLKAKNSKTKKGRSNNKRYNTPNSHKNVNNNGYSKPKSHRINGYGKSISVRNNLNNRARKLGYGTVVKNNNRIYETINGNNTNYESINNNNNNNRKKRKKRTKKRAPMPLPRPRKT